VATSRAAPNSRISSITARRRFDSVPSRHRPATKTGQLRELLTSPDLCFLMEAHSALSAKIAEEAGFEGLWASGLSVSAALGVRDSNEASWTQVLEVLEFMADATTVPILLDGDTGYGNFNNFRRLVAKLGQRGIAGVCIEDKLFPKTNSFLGANQPLADVDEFCGKIKAGKDSQTDPDFVIVARIEALVSGLGMDEALRRAEAYHDAGADALLIHSKRSTATEVLEFCRAWEQRCPVVLVPTKYYATPTSRFRDAGVSAVIWANHNLRASITAMRRTCEVLRAEESLISVEDEVAPLADVFALAGNAELEQAEKRYVAGRPQTGAVVLAATRGSALADLTQERPKCMLDVRGEALLHRHVRLLREHGVDAVTVVAGYRPDAVDVPGIDKVVNESYASTGEVYSLSGAAPALSGDCIIGFGDILFRGFLLSMLLKSEADFTLVIDADGRRATSADGEAEVADRVACTVPFTEDFMDDSPVALQAIGDDVDTADGRWVGLMKLSVRGAGRVREELAAMAADGTLRRADMGDLFRRLMAGGERLSVIYVRGNWLDVNDAFDLAQARNVP